MTITNIKNDNNKVRSKSLPSIKTRYILTPRKSKNFKKSTIHIFGAGDAGIFTTLMHLKAGYKVNLYEKAKTRNTNNKLTAIRRSTSGKWLRQHGGGEYPTDDKTAVNLLNASIIMSKLMPDIIYNSKTGNVKYLISKKSQLEGIRTIEKQKEVMNKVKKQYEKIYNKDQDSRIYGHPDQFVKLKLDDKEFDKDKFAGGIKTNEKGINPIIMTKVLTDMLRPYLKNGQLTIHDNCHITKIQKIKLTKETKFLCLFQNSKGEEDARLIKGKIINCTGISTFDIACQIDKEQLKSNNIKELKFSLEQWEFVIYQRLIPKIKIMPAFLWVQLKKQREKMI